MSMFATVQELYASFDGGDGQTPSRVRGFLIGANSDIAELDTTTDPGVFPRVGSRDTVNPELVCHSREFRRTGDGTKTFAECFYVRPSEVWPTKDDRSSGYKVDSGLTRIGVIRQPQVFSRTAFGGGEFEHTSDWIEYIIPEQVYEIGVNVELWSLSSLSTVSTQTGKIHTFGIAPGDKWLFLGAQYNHTRAKSDTEYVTRVNYRWVGRTPIEATVEVVSANGTYLPLPELPPFFEYRVAGASQGGPLSAPEILTVPVYDEGDASVLPGNPIGIEAPEK